MASRGRKILPGWVREFVADRQGRLCFYCGGVLKKFVLDHLVPRSRGGRDWEDNRVASCVRCDKVKKNFPPNELQLARQARIREARPMPHQDPARALSGGALLLVQAGERNLASAKEGTSQAIPPG